MKNYECLIKHECKRCLKRKECHLGCSSPKEFRVLKKMWGGERMRSYSGLWDRQTYRSQEINVGTKGPRMKWMANPVGIACEPWKWLKWNGACVCEPWKWLKWNGARVWAVKVAQIKWIFWHLKMWGSGEFLLSETMRGFEFECYLGLNACVAWLLSTEYLERFTAILPLENVSLLPATTRDRWQYIRGQKERKLALYRSTMLDKKSSVYLCWNCMSERNRRAVWPWKILLSFGVNWWSATCYWEYVWCGIFREG